MTEPRLPDLLSDRLGISPRVTALVAAAVLALSAAAVAVRLLGGSETTFFRDAPPAFRISYSPEALRPAAPRPGELMRLESRRRRLHLSLVARPLRLPPYRGSSATGLLPARAAARARRLARDLDGFVLRAEGFTRIGDAHGYEVQFAAGRRRAGRDILLLPGEGPRRTGVILSVRQRRKGRLSARDRDRLSLVRVALRSFEFRPV